MNAKRDQKQNLDTAISETQYMLERWRFAASDRGFLWIQPLSKAMSPEEFAALFTLLHRCCDTDFPKGIVFDFSKVVVTGGQWTSLIDVIDDFAMRINARCRFVAGEHRPVSAVYMHVVRSRYRN